MENVVDVLITFFIVGIIVFGQALKVKKKIEKDKKKIGTAPRRKVMETVEKKGNNIVQEPEFWSQTVMSENEKFEGNSSKMTSYFTYEDNSDQGEYELASNRPNPSETHENHIQEVENETETVNINLRDCEELKKAVIYSEILKNPYI